MTGRGRNEVERYFGYGRDSSVGKPRKLVLARDTEDSGLSGKIDWIEAAVRTGMSKKHSDE